MDADIVVIGGGITGLGIARDASMRGFSVILIEKNELGSGTSGYFHGILHSGARYAVVDPEAAKECYSENQTLRNILKDAIIDTGGLFIALDDNDLEYSNQLMKACKELELPIADLSPEKVLKQEPFINQSLKRSISVPDGYINGIKTIKLLESSLKNLGVRILTHSEVVGFEKDTNTIQATKIKHKNGDETKIKSKFVINAAGIWAANIVKDLNLNINLVGDKGSLIVFKEKFSNSLLNRCRLPSDGDQFLPTESEYIIGTTSKKTPDINSHEVEKWEVDKLLEEARQMLPGISGSQITRTFAGVRPLYGSGSTVGDGRLDKRSFAVINHKEEGVNNLISVVGGKFILFRLMGEKAVDEICKEIGVDKKCQTAVIPL